MDLMTFAAVDVPIVGPVLWLGARWVVLRSRTELVRAAGDLPPGVRVSGRDVGGAWSATRTPVRRAPR
jgi:hypothetical protein